MKYFEVTCQIRPFSQDAADLLSAMLAEIGFESFSQTDGGLLAYVQQSVWSEEEMQEVVQNFCLPEVEISYTLAEAPDEDWNQVWEEEGFQPISLPLAPSQGGGMIVVHDVKHTDVPPAKYDILITPRLAFGTGSHETTRLILRTLAHLDLASKHIIDAGTGTGILAIMAIKRGAASVFAYDIDEWSVENTKDNLLLNRIKTLSDSPLKEEKQKASPLRGGLEGSVVVVCGDSSVLKGQPKADLLIANINRNILLQDLPRFASSIKAGGQMILSGFYLEDIPVLKEAASKLGFTLLKTESEGDWAMLLFEADALGRRDI
ncbi:MAG: 50S ribosomal protein L11 methyltransferase [Bacteroidaceae bacterium]|nr:50S ribosomal protein L11 methyltransferase [Bacteroidaceae bacterium]